VVETTQYIATQFSTLDRQQRLKLVKAFRVGLIPRKPSGRKRRKEITAAYEDLEAGDERAAALPEAYFGLR
jgi:hypothetical protein